MSDTSVRTPPHLWIVGFVSLMWNGFGAYDYTMTAARNPAYLAQFPAEVMQVIDAFPTWVVAVWALGVWGAVAGSLLLLLRSRYAVQGFGVSLLGLAASTVYQLGADMPDAMKTADMVIVNLLIWAAAILFLSYAARMRRVGVLR